MPVKLMSDSKRSDRYPARRSTELGMQAVRAQYAGSWAGRPALSLTTSVRARALSWRPVLGPLALLEACDLQVLEFLKQLDRDDEVPADQTGWRRHVHGSCYLPGVAIVGPLLDVIHMDPDSNGCLLDEFTKDRPSTRSTRRSGWRPQAQKRPSRTVLDPYCMLALRLEHPHAAEDNTVALSRSSCWLQIPSARGDLAQLCPCPRRAQRAHSRRACPSPEHASEILIFCGTGKSCPCSARRPPVQCKTSVFRDGKWHPGRLRAAAANLAGAARHPRLSVLSSRAS